IGAKLKMQHLARRSFSAFSVKWRSRAVSRPDSLALPACLRIVDSAVHPFGVESHRIGNAKDNELPAAGHQGEQRIIPVAGGDRRIFAQPKRVELIHPVVVTGLGAPRISAALQLRSRQWIEPPAFWTVLPGRGGSIERSFAFPPVEAGKVPAADDRPHDAAAINVQPSRREPM